MCIKYHLNCRTNNDQTPDHILQACSMFHVHREASPNMAEQCGPGNQALGNGGGSPPDGWICVITRSEDLMTRSSNAGRRRRTNNGLNQLKSAVEHGRLPPFHLYSDTICKCITCILLYAHATNDGMFRIKRTLQLRTVLKRHWLGTAIAELLSDWSGHHVFL